jgi:hypothetical protein
VSAICRSLDATKVGAAAIWRGSPRELGVVQQAIRAASGQSQDEQDRQQMRKFLTDRIWPHG